ncbi:XRE family transcriptional regulator [Vibrio lentus]|uniref:Phage repressor protein n=1 Tax=Vibrio lentus TaxID=136468 RepID=A0A2N7KP14_9VIBR|nr:XRE family transcriptional regulator [Vibrio lentus]PMM78439.1 phage repressor protein [Vibrio lentus]
MRFGDRLKIQRKLKGITQLEIAEHVSLSKMAVSRWEKGDSIPAGETLNDLAKLLEVEPKWLLTGDLEGHREHVIFVDFYHEIFASAGDGNLCNNEAPEMYPIPKSIVENEGEENICCIRAKGNSMTPVLQDGSIIALNINKKELRDGMMYVIRQGDLLRVKVLIETPDNIIIRSYNQDFDDEVISKDARLDENLTIVGRVVWHSSYLAS